MKRSSSKILSWIVVGTFLSLLVVVATYSIPERNRKALLLERARLAMKQDVELESQLSSGHKEAIEELLNRIRENSYAAPARRLLRKKIPALAQIDGGDVLSWMNARLSGVVFDR